MLSLDPTLLAKPEGSARARHLDYAARCGRLSIIVRTRGGASAPVLASNELTLIPSASRHPALYPWDTLRIGQALYDVDLIVTQDQFTSGIGGIWLRDALRVPVLVQNHTTIFDNPAWLSEKPLRNRVLLTLARYVRARADFVRTVNERERRAAIAAGLPAERVAALPLGTISATFVTPPPDAEVAAVRAALGLLPEHRVILWVGYLVGFKRVPLLLEVFKRIADTIPNARLLLVGDLSRSFDELRGQIVRLGLGERVIMPGAVVHDKLPVYYAVADAYALTSSYEGVPRVLMEAASMGLPIVAMRVPGVDEIIEDGVTGCLVTDGDAGEMAAQIVGVLNDSTRAKAIAHAARARALQKYASDTYAERWVALWQHAAKLGMRT